MGVNVRIEELVLTGFGPGMDADLVAAAFTTELERLIRVRGVPLAQSGADLEVDGVAGLPPVPSRGSPARVGRELARSVHAGLSGRGRDVREGGR